MKKVELTGKEIEIITMALIGRDNRLAELIPTITITDLKAEYISDSKIIKSLIHKFTNL